jgi:hypothetical protein
MRRPLPVYGWLGLLVILVSHALMLARVEPFYHWHTPIAWTGYILFADAIVWKRRGDSWLRNNRAELFFAACASVPLWVVFEIYNKYSIHNWYYVGLPDVLLLRYLGYAWSFATITPAIFETGDLVSSLRDRRGPPSRAQPTIPRRLGPGAWICVAAGAAMLVLPIFVHSTYFAAPVFLGFVLFLDPLNARAGRESILGDGNSRRLVNLLVAGFICGGLWEFWNYWSGAKWIYNVPIFSDVKIFEMPVLGFAGFPPFAVECFVMYVWVRGVFWRHGSRPIAV